MAALQTLLLLIGLAIVVAGANLLVDGATSLARRMGVSDFVIGLTIVGIGTSMPELVVSFTGAIQGNSAVSVGNVMGSNIFNVFMILGVSAVLRPIDITSGTLRRDMPLNICVTLAFILCGMSLTLFGLGPSDNISRMEGAAFLLLYAAYLFLAFRTDGAAASPQPEVTASATQDAAGSVRSVWVAVLMVAGGLLCLVFGGRLFVDSAVNIAKMLGISDKFIAVTILAAGTSMPELMTNIVAAIKGKGQLALGNILGSNIGNILLILGGSALILPLSLGDAGIKWVDLGVLLLSSIALPLTYFTNRRKSIDRAEGVAFILVYAGYMAWLVGEL